MAADKKQDKQSRPPQKQSDKPEKKQVIEKPKKTAEERPEFMESLIRIAGYDVPGTKNLYTGLTRIKGISWTISNALCINLGIPHSKKISDLSKEEIKRIEDALKNFTVKDFLKNRRNDVDTGETKHFFGTDLDMRKDFDIRRLKKIRSYRGVRHTAGQPVRGQRTKSHFRQKGRSAVGVKRKGK